MGLGWHRTAWQRATSAAQRGVAATRPHLDDLRDWLNTGWGNPVGSAPGSDPDDLDPLDPLLSSRRPGQRDDARPTSAQEHPR
jgi:hypothetical protein